MEQLPAIADALPGSCIVLTHRDPVASIQSALTGLAYSSRLTRDGIDFDGLVRYWVDRYERLLRACVRDRDLISDDRSHDVYFRDLTTNPTKVVEDIHDKAGLPMNEESRTALTEALNENARGRHGQIAYDLRRDFGIEPAAIRQRFDFYFDRFPVDIEVT
jgi:hypothetical protein